MGGEPAKREPSAGLAATLATEVAGLAPEAVRRFPTGARHYVYEATFANRPPIVIRVGDTTAHSEMAGAVHLSELLKPRGAPLPAILAADVRAELPWMALERLPGVDLGAAIATLSAAQLDGIAAEVARAQSIASQTGSAGLYGYAVRPEQAKYSTWSHALDAHLDRSRRRIVSAGLFDAALADVLQAELAAVRGETDAIPATPFLHDTTTRNVIVTADGAVSGIVDVDDLCFGDARFPAALTLAVLIAYGGPVQYVSAWLRHAGLPDDRLFRIYVSLFLLDLMGEHGQAFNGNEHPSSVAARAALWRAFEGSVSSLQS